MPNLKAKEYRQFEDIKYIRKDGSEYWSARELAPVLDYSQWRNFQKVIDRAMIACENSGHEVTYDFAEVSKIVEAGAASKSIKDYELTRYACYLIVQNGDPRKEVIALGQTYFAIQTYRQEIADHFNQLNEDRRRLVVRGDIKQWNQLLVETAHDAGVITNEEFAIFQNAGYMGLYGGLDVLYKDIDAMGYDWNKILTLTRNWWTMKHYSDNRLQYLHILNLLKLRVGLYENKLVLDLIRKDK